MALSTQTRRRQLRKNIVSLAIILFFLGTLLMIPGVSRAGGLYLNEFGTPSMGVAGAGAGAVASDASTSFHNAAGMTRIKGKELMGTAGLLNATGSRSGESLCTPTTAKLK